MTNYHLAPFCFDVLADDILLSNEAGRYIFLSPQCFEDFLAGRLITTEPLFDDLCKQGFAYSDTRQEFLDTWSQQVRRNKACHFTATQLFILVLTTACNQRCVYCQASAGTADAYMSWDVARQAVELAFQSPAPAITLEFQGGEPTLNSSVLKQSVRYAKELAEQTGKQLSMSLVTNLTCVREDLLQWLLQQGVSICTSLDGPDFLHNTNRPMMHGKSSYDVFSLGVKKYQDLCKNLGMSTIPQAIQTTTRSSLAYGREIVHEYMRWGIDSLYLRPLTPLGLAAAQWEEIGYSPEEYLAYYCDIIHCLLEMNERGIPMREVTASIYLRRILLNESISHTEHRSPCGGGIGQMAIQPNGDVYTCDEARMLATTGESIFRIGCIQEKYSKLIASPAVHAVCTASCIESLPMCCDCVFHPYCATCPVVTYGTEKALVSQQAESYHCKISKGILTFLFSVLHHGGEADITNLHKWAHQ